METSRPMVVSIAGFDPSGGAGILADIKTFDQHRVYGLGVITANTFQTDSVVEEVNWIPAPQIKEQLGLLIERWNPEWFKIGIIENSDVLEQILVFITEKNPEAKIVWDPVLRSSSGFSLFKSDHSITKLLKYIKVLTPNLPEFEFLIGSEEKAMSLSQQTMIYLKGGHREKAQLGEDWLYWKGIKYILQPSRIGDPKHGSGCILSSAICANLALNIPVPLAFEKAKHYIEKVLSSNPTLLGWHT